MPKPDVAAAQGSSYRYRVPRPAGKLTPVTTPSQGNEMRVVAAMLSCATLAEVSLAGLSLNLA